MSGIALPFSVETDLPLGRRIAPYLVDRDGDVVIRQGDVPEYLEGDGIDGATYQIRGDRMLIQVPGGPRYLIEGGRDIRYAYTEGNGDKEVALFLLGSVWGALCYQRGLIPLHASAIAIDGRVHAFTGHSGAGKSTLVAALAARGRPFFTDDVLILDPAQLTPEPLCFTGQKDLKLWQDAITMTGAERGAPVRSVENFAKFYASPDNESNAVVGRFANLVFLADNRNGTEPEIETLTGARTVTRLVTSVYRPAFAEAILGRRALYEGLTKLVGKVQLHRFRRRFDAKAFDAGVDFLDEWIGTHG